MPLFIEVTIVFSILICALRKATSSLLELKFVCLRCD
jgi:hypothetical protein